MRIFMGELTGKIYDLESKQDFASVPNCLEGNLLCLNDHYDPLGYSQNFFKYYGTPKYILCNGYNSVYHPNTPNVYCLNQCFANDVLEFDKIEYPNFKQLRTDNTVNFCINKKQLNRFLTIKFCEIFKLDCKYTWSGFGKDFDLEFIIQEKRTVDCAELDCYWHKILSPIKKFEPQWAGPSGIAVHNSFVRTAESNFQNWNKGLCNIFLDTGISLISESVLTNFCTMFTEKTLFSILGCNFPIWVGGYNQADEFKKYGFDVFDDIINHDYQSYSTVIERCFYAFSLNREILQNKQLVHKLRMDNIERFKKNIENINSQKIKINHQNIVKQWPVDLQKIAPKLFDIKI